MFCRKKDLAESPGDYYWMKDELLANHNLCYFKEYDVGNMGLVIPKERIANYDKLVVAKHFDKKAKYQSGKNFRKNCKHCSKRCRPSCDNDEAWANWIGSHAVIF